MVVPQPIRHRYTFDDPRGSQFIWIEFHAHGRRFKTDDLLNEQRFDWSVHIRTENIEQPGVVRDKKFTLNDVASDGVKLLLAVQPILDSMKQGQLSG